MPAPPETVSFLKSITMVSNTITPTPPFPFIHLQKNYLQCFLFHDGVVSRMCSVGVSELEGTVNTAHGKADHVADVESTQEVEVRLSILLPLQAHQLFHRGLF